MNAIGQMIARVFTVNADKAFGAIVSEYAFEVFQETYDADQLKQRVAARRRAQAHVRAKRKRDEDLMKRLDRMGDYYDQEKPKQNK